MFGYIQSPLLSFLVEVSCPTFEVSAVLTEELELLDEGAMSPI